MNFNRVGVFCDEPVISGLSVLHEVPPPEMEVPSRENASEDACLGALIYPLSNISLYLISEKAGVLYFSEVISKGSSRKAH